MLDISAWMQDFLRALEDTFAQRLWFVGLQGSYGRGEATEHSDIDVVVILNELLAEDIRKYNDMLDTLSPRELICGFLAGKDELLSWEPSDLFQFYHDTTPIKGNLDVLLPLLDRDAIGRAIKIGACNVYHGCVHNMLHEKSEGVLRALYKSASFVIQASLFYQTGRYARTQNDLFLAASAQDRRILEILKHLRSGGTAELEKMSDILFAWAKTQIITKNVAQRCEF